MTTIQIEILVYCIGYVLAYIFLRNLAGPASEWGIIIKRILGALLSWMIVIILGPIILVEYLNDNHKPPKWL